MSESDHVVDRVLHQGVTSAFRDEADLIRG
ncbi:MAG: hypothetical protein QOH67_3837 [Hyphomicrobiales bacterium]|jgi:hypothetical protein|nr:hypothetical protein [Hyphomicrobiales bacterium]